MLIVMLDGAVSAVDVEGRQASAYHCVKKAKSVWFLFLAWGNPWFLTRHRAFIFILFFFILMWVKW